MRKAVICFHPRSGSSWLVNLLEHNSSFLVKYEILSEPASAQEQRTVLDDFHSEIAKAHKGAFFKLAPYQIIDKPGVCQWLKRRDFFMVALIRKNLVRTVISRLRSRELKRLSGEVNLITKEGGLPTGVKKAPPIQVEMEEFWRMMRIDETQRQDVMALSALYQSFGGRSIVLCYEDLLKDQLGSKDRLERFLDIDISSFEETTIAKNTGQTLSDEIINYDELKTALADTPYANVLP